MPKPRGLLRRRQHRIKCSHNPLQGKIAAKGKLPVTACPKQHERVSATQPWSLPIHPCLTLDANKLTFIDAIGRRYRGRRWRLGSRAGSQRRQDAHYKPTGFSYDKAGSW